MQTFTLEELKHYDGQEGRAAYVAVDGTVYDVSQVGPWQGGTHHGNYAGQDLSQAITHAPHLKTVLPKLPVVGKLQA